jgi:hypothetical protein
MRPFSLDEINLRKKLVFPDGTIQSTAYTGAVGGPTLAEVLADGNDANFLSIDNLSQVTITDGVNFSQITQLGVSLDIASGNASGTNNSTITLYATDGAGVPAVAMTIADAVVTVVPLLDVTSIRYPDGSVQTAGTRDIEALSTAVLVPLTTGVPHIIYSTISLPPGSYGISGWVQNEAVLTNATNIQYSCSIANGFETYQCGFTSIATQSDTQNPKPYLPITGFFRNTQAVSTVFNISQVCTYTGGYQQFNSACVIYYLGA